MKAEIKDGRLVVNYEDKPMTKDDEWRLMLLYYKFRLEERDNQKKKNNPHFINSGGNINNY